MSENKNEMVVSGHVEYIEKNLAVIQNQFNLSKDDLAFFAIQCKRTGLDPITRQIYAIPNGNKLNIMASIDGLRLIAERSGVYEGQTKAEWCGSDGVWKDVWLEATPPKASRVGVYKNKFREPLVAVALYHEYAGQNPTFMWKKMPALMIAKVAEALALRKAFPNEMSGIYSDEEMAQANIPPANNSQAPSKDALKEVNESKKAAEMTDDPFEFVIQLGKNKLTGTKIKDHKIDFLIKYANESKQWHLDNNKKPHSNTQAFFDMVDLASGPKLNETETIPF